MNTKTKLFILIICIFITIPIKSNAYTINSKWQNKTWLCIGDSITENNSRSNKNYENYIADKINCKIINKGIGGTGYYNRYDLKNINEKADLITVFLGTNDYGNINNNNLPLGNFGDKTNNTISGCINLLLINLKNKYANSKLAVFTPIPRVENYGDNPPFNKQGYNLKQLSDRIIEYCNYYKIPVLDLYDYSYLNVQEPQFNSFYFTAPNQAKPDGLHPNDNGHKVLAEEILNFLNTIDTN